MASAKEQEGQSASAPPQMVRIGPATASSSIVAPGARGSSWCATDAQGTGRPASVHAATCGDGLDACTTLLGESATTPRTSAGKSTASSCATSLPREAPQTTIRAGSTPG